MKKNDGIAELHTGQKQLRGGAGSEINFLSLQGGGALGAYHVGVIRSMTEHGQPLDWVSGISIGAFTAALVAGNTPERRVEKLRAFWRDISREDSWGTQLNGYLRKAFNNGGFLLTSLFGQPNFFTPRLMNPYFALPGTPEAMSTYDTRPVLDTLARLVDFDLINSKRETGRPRLTLGTTRVESGELVFFDNDERPLAPQHVVASGALPPAFPPSRIDGGMYWDGGVSGNTPIEAFTNHSLAYNFEKTRIFSIDLYDTEAPLPQTMDDVTVRRDAIQYGNRTKATIHTLAQRITLRRAIRRLLEDASPEKKALYGDLAFTGERVDLIQLTYQRSPEDIVHGDGDFSRPTIQAREEQGYRAMELMMRYRPWEQPLSASQQVEDPCVFVHRIHGGQVLTDAYVVRGNALDVHTSSAKSIAASAAGVAPVSRVSAALDSLSA